MTDGKRKALRITARVVVLMSLAGQALLVIFVSWNFSSLIECDQLLYWGEWIACLHEEPNSPILMTEGCVIIWVVAGIGALLGRFLRPYISVVVPAGVAVAVIWFVHENLNLAEPLPRLEHIFVFATAVGSTAILIGGPVVGAWLWGLSRRGRRSPLLRLSAVFDSAR